MKRALSVLVLFACTPTEPATTPSPPTPVAPEPTKAVVDDAKPAERPPERFACVRDDDCLASCAHGAVAKAWHVAAYPGEEACEDGCTSKGTDPPRCESMSCVAYRQGARDPICTNVDRPPSTAPGPAHRCTTAADCTQRCDFGVINREWLSWKDHGPDCKGGCTAVGFDDPKCENGRCVAFRSGERHEECTGKSVR